MCETSERRLPVNVPHSKYGKLGTLLVSVSMPKPINIYTHVWGQHKLWYLSTHLTLHHSLSIYILVYISVYTLKDISSSQERLCQVLSKNYKSACAICWENIILNSHPEMEISFKFIPKVLMSTECIHFFGPLSIWWFYCMTAYLMNT